jgi:hypothetical protein
LTQVPDMLKNTPKHVKVLYQPNLESTQNQPRFLRLKFWAQAVKLRCRGYHYPIKRPLRPIIIDPSYCQASQHEEQIVLCDHELNYTPPSSARIQEMPTNLPCVYRRNLESNVDIRFIWRGRVDPCCLQPPAGWA